MDTKAALRKQVDAAVRAMSDESRRAESDAAQRALIALPEFAKAQAVLAYWALPSEIATANLLRATLDSGKRLALPRFDSTAPFRVSAAWVRDFDADLAPVTRGPREPLASLPDLDVSELDLIVLPGRAFDAQGRRLGRGGGFYDRLLDNPACTATRAALAFDCQITATVPVEAHDHPVHLIVTHTRILRA